jgi:hypothetical protein
MTDDERVGSMRNARSRVVIAQCDGQIQRARTLSQESAIGETDELAIRLTPRDLETQVRPDTRRLARTQRDTRD